VIQKFGFVFFVFTHSHTQFTVCALLSPSVATCGSFVCFSLSLSAKCGHNNPGREVKMFKLAPSRWALFFLCLSACFGAACNKLGQPNDSGITTDIKAKMFSDPSLKAASVEVSVRSGEVTLTGQVPDDAARLAAYKIASEAKGVSKVNDQMTVQAGQTAAGLTPGTNATAPPLAPAASSPPDSPAKRASGRTRSSAGQAQAASAASAAASAGAGESAAPGRSSASTAPLSPQPKTVTVPAGSTISIRMIDGVDTATNKTGEVFKASLDAPIVVDDQVIVPKGSDVAVKLVSASSAGKIKGRSELTLAAETIVFQGKTYNISTTDVRQAGASRGKRSAATIGGGAALGALIGGLAGGGKGAAIGAAVGGGAGTGVQVFTKGQQIRIPSETKLDFTLEQPFDITYLPGKKIRQPANNGDQPSGSAPDASSDRPPAN
jgi:hypothetical protein